MHYAWKDSTTPNDFFWLGCEHKAYPFGVCHKDAFLVYHLPDTLVFVSSNTGTPVRLFLSGLEQHIRSCFLYA